MFPIRGQGQAMVDIAAGRITFLMTTGLAAAKPFLDSGKVRALALTGDKRAAAAPDIPTFTEAGSRLPEMGAGAVVGCRGAGGDAARHRGQAERGHRQALAARTSREIRLPQHGSNAEHPGSVCCLINETMETWAEVLKRANIKTLD